MHPTRGSRSADRATARPRPAPGRPEPKAPEESRWRYVRVVYPVNPGIPHFLDFPGERK